MAADNQNESLGDWIQSLTPDERPNESNNDSPSKQTNDTTIHSFNKYTEQIADELRELADQHPHSSPEAELDVFESWIGYLLASFTGNQTKRQETLDTTDSPTTGQATIQQAATDDTTDFTQSKFEEATKLLINGSHDTDTDLISPVIQELNLAKKDNLSQNFTPPFIASFMVESTIDTDHISDLNGETVSRPIITGDPSCGGGVFLVELANKFQSYNAPPPPLVMGQDIDPLVAKVATINMAIHGIPGFIIRGDTLLEESENVWRIGPITPDPSPALVAELPAETLPDGFGSYPNGTTNIDKTTDINWNGTIPEEIGSTPYSEIPKTDKLFEAYERIDPSNGIDPGT